MITAPALVEVGLVDASPFRLAFSEKPCSLPHQHVVNHLEGLGTDADAATVGIIHEEQEMDLQSEEHGEKSCHPQVHGEILGLKEPAHGEAQHCSYEDEPPQRPRQMRGYAVQPQAALLDEVVVGAKGLEI